MELNTASEVISFAKKLEEDGVKLYEDLAQEQVQGSEFLLSFAKENKKNALQIERTYYEVITDAMEGCFSFKINPDEYALKTGLAEGARYSDALNKAIKMEEKTIKFYSDAAAQSESLLADVPRIFTLVAKRRGDRRTKLEALLDKSGSIT